MIALWIWIGGTIAVLALTVGDAIESKFAIGFGEVSGALLWPILLPCWIVDTLRKRGR